MKATNYGKLGLFVVLGIVLATVAIIYFSAGLLGRSTIEYQVYFDESVQGLDVGSLVRFRGVTIGQVRRIRVAPDARHIQVTCALRTSDLRSQGLAGERDGQTALVERPGLRAQLALIGLSGQEILLLDFFDPTTHPVPKLDFATPPRTIPSTPSTIVALEESLQGSAARLPDLIEAVQRLADELVDVLAPLAGANLGARAAETLHHADEVLGAIRGVVRQLADERIPEGANRAIGQLDSALSSLNELLTGMQGNGGLVASAQRASDAVGNAAQGSNAIGRELDETLREAHGALQAVRRLAEGLQRQPDMLLKGRAGSHP